MKQGWEIKRLDDACEVEYGTRVVNKRDGGTIYPVYGGGGATFFMDTFNREDCFIVARFAMSEQCTRFVKGKFFLNDSGLSVKPRNTKEILQDFLNLQLLYLNDHIYSLARGTAQKNLDVPAFRIIEINYPKSLPEQRRIVSILDEAFAAIAKAKANAEQNLKNAKELFESYLQGVFEKKGDGWEHIRLGDVCQINDGTHFSPKNSSDGKYMYITAKNIKPYYIDLTKISYISEKDHKEIYARCSPVKGDVLYIKDGATAGIATLNTLDEEFSLLSSVALLKCSNKILNTFLVHYMNSTIGRKNFLGYIDGAAITRLTLIKIKNVCFSLPPIKTQQIIVQKLDTLSAETQKLETIYQTKLNDLEELKKSVLEKAFNGELKTAEQCA